MSPRCAVVSTILFFGASLVQAHNIWFEKQGDGYRLAYGHAQGERYDVARFKGAAAFNKEGAPIALEVLASASPVRVRPRPETALLTAELDNGFWIKTPEGSKNLSKRAAPNPAQVIESFWSRKFAKAILHYSPAASQPLPGIVFQLIPQSDPRLLQPGERLRLQAIANGRPLARQDLKLEGQSYEGEKAVTDSQGFFDVVIKTATTSVIIASFKRALPGSPDVDQEMLAASLSW